LIADSIRFRHLRLAVLGLDRPCLTPNASLYFPSRHVPFTRLYEPKNRSPDMAPDDQTVVVLEWPCHREDEAWDQSADELREHARALLAAQGLIDGDEVVAFDDHAVPFAYPILDVVAEEKAERLKSYLNRFDNLHRLGRSADFTYTHVHNLYARAKALTGRLAERTGSDCRRTR
jgi:protoporphyrinogen oxidase